MRLIPHHLLLLPVVLDADVAIPAARADQIMRAPQGSHSPVMQVLELQGLLRFVKVEYLDTAIREPHTYLIVVLHECHRAEIIGWVLRLEYFPHFASTA